MESPNGSRSIAVKNAKLENNQIPYVNPSWDLKDYIFTCTSCGKTLEKKNAVMIQFRGGYACSIMCMNSTTQ